MIEIAVIGAGRIGRIHARNVAAHPGARLVGIADPDAAAVAALAEATGSRVLSLDEASRILVNWYKTPFDGGRHQARVDMMSQKKV
jgi:predicted dehydrogenase